MCVLNYYTCDELFNSNLESLADKGKSNDLRFPEDDVCVFNLASHTLLISEFNHP